MFEHRFLPLKNDSFRKPPPPLKDNHRACDHNAMLVFPQEQISHYTTGEKAPKNEKNLAKCPPYEEKVAKGPPI